MKSFTDASFAPGGDRSRSGVAIFWKGGFVFWYSKRQPWATLSTPESELGGCVPGIKFGIGIKDLTDRLSPEQEHEEGFDLLGDNTATVITTTKEVTSWRSRHYAYSAGWARDQVARQPIQVSHLPCKELPADGLTKILPGTEVKGARIKLSMRNGTENNEDLHMYAREW